MQSKFFHNNARGFILIGMLFTMLLLAVTAIAMNRRAGIQAKMAANKTRSVQVSLGQLAAMEDAAWQLTQNPNWRTAAEGEDFVYDSITYNRKVLNSSVPGYEDAVTIRVTAPDGTRKPSRSFGINAPSSAFLLIVDTYNHCIRKVDLTTGLITTVAGICGSVGYSGDDGPATEATLDLPRGIAVDDSGNIYIADTGNDRVRMLDTSGIITTVAGTGATSFNGDDIPATTANLYYPTGIALDSAGNLYIADAMLCRVRKVDTSGIITTVAGMGNVCNPYVDGAVSTEVCVLGPWGVWVDPTGDPFYIALDHNVLKVEGGIIDTVAGSGQEGCWRDDEPALNQKLARPYDLSLDSSGNIYVITRWCENKSAKVDTAGIITTFVGVQQTGYSGDGGPATSAKINEPWGIGMDASGNIYLADTMNHVIRKIDSAGIITTIAGTGEVSGYAGDGGPATSALLNQPNDAAFCSGTSGSASLVGLAELY